MRERIYFLRVREGACYCERLLLRVVTFTTEGMCNRTLNTDQGCCYVCYVCYCPYTRALARKEA